MPDKIDLWVCHGEQNRARGRALVNFLGQLERAAARNKVPAWLGACATSHFPLDNFLTMQAMPSKSMKLHPMALKRKKN